MCDKQLTKTKNIATFWIKHFQVSKKVCLFMKFVQGWRFNKSSGGSSRLERVDLFRCAAHQTSRK